MQKTYHERCIVLTFFVYSYFQKGPLEIRLMMGESQVLKSIMEYSIPRLVGVSVIGGFTKLVF